MPPYKDLPANQLVTVQPGVQLEANTAAAYLALKAAQLAEAGEHQSIALPAGGYRSHAVDVDMHAHPAKYNINPAIGLLPVDYSEHRTGRCVDFTNYGAWTKANAHRWGFTHPIAVDVNHFAHDGTTTADNGTSPIESDDFLMALSEYDQELIRNAVVDINNRTADQTNALAAQAKQLAVIAGKFAATKPDGTPFGFDWFPALNNNLTAILTELQKITKALTTK